MNNRLPRKLAAVLYADVAGYSKLTGDDEDATHKTLSEYLDLITQVVESRRGNVLHYAGDAVLAMFAAVVDAVSCATDIQKELFTRNAALPDERKVLFRIGVNLGDIIEDRGDIYGDGVNVAARLESLAMPGGICVSSAVYEQINGKLDLRLEDMGEQELKNISGKIRAYRITPEAEQMTPETREKLPAINLELPDKPSIAVLPFDNMSGDPEQEYFADGIVEGLTAELSRIRAFFVIARNSAFVYKGKAGNVREIGRELGVAYLLEGSVQRAGDKVRITVQLVETSGGAHIWADRYDGALDDIFDLQDRIIEQVAGALQPSIRIAEIERSRRKRPQQMGAYDYTMQALSHVWMLEKEEAVEALDLLNKALEISPGYPLALALSAWCHAQSSVYNWVDDIDQAREKALSIAEQAANLSSEDPLILTVLGTVHTFIRNYGTARVLLERAVTLDPNSAWTYSRLGWLSVYADRPEEARSFFEKALRLSPIDPMNFNNYVGIASSYQVAGDDKAASAGFQRALDERKNAHWIHRNLAPALLGAGKKQEAQRSLEILIAAYPNLTIKHFKNAMVFSPAVLDRIGAQLLELGVPEE
jgi:adenylate cyclase